MVKIRQKDGEDLSRAKIKEVIELLEQEKPITKKEACNMLKIAYNTSRLQKIIENYNDEIENLKRRKIAKRGKPIEKAEITTICESYLSGSPISEISEIVARNANIIKRVLKQQNIPIRHTGASYFDPPVIEDDALADDYIKGDLVYSAKYQSIATIDGEGKDYPTHGKVFPIWISGDRCRFAYQPWYELADLRRLQKEYGIKAIDMSKEEIVHAVNTAVLKANKGKKGKTDRDEF
jgi:Zn-finger protein